MLPLRVHQQRAVVGVEDCLVKQGRLLSARHIAFDGDIEISHANCFCFKTVKTRCGLGRCKVDNGTIGLHKELDLALRGKSHAFSRFIDELLQGLFFEAHVTLRDLTELRVENMF